MVAAALACGVLALGVDRFGFELCHRGFPLATLTIALPAVGFILSVVAFFLRGRAWLIAFKLAAAALNGYQLVVAAIILNGIGIAPCS